ncbi:hypothetical protein [Thermophilibacter provencensis]|uniref:Uncharacterized protein n=1 Tax=Thermophilibacter provencensis TaxID=1852386 RepID=A0ABT7V1B5_9ACTN|nr:hypothetical protein [Thermophilibacter provencensis]MDM8270405.1 hypothetical protein [Thermophilibacter provencensis]
MSDNQRKLKYFSFAIMIFALLHLIGGAFLIAASPLAAGLRLEVAGDMTDGVIASEVLGIVAIIVGVYCLIVGVMGARSANNPRHVGGFKKLDMALILVAFIEFLMSLTTGQISWTELAIACVGIFAYLYAVKANEEVLG